MIFVPAFWFSRIVMRIFWILISGTASLLSHLDLDLTEPSSSSLAMTMASG